MEKFLHPSSIAFMGASNNLATMGTVQLINLISGGFKGKIYPVHPSEEYVIGIKAYRTLFEIPEVPDLLVMVLPTHLVIEKLKEAGSKGIDRVVIISAGFSEVGRSDLQEELKKTAQDLGIRIIGPNCIGLINTSLSMNFTYVPYDAKPGWVGIASHSGTYICHIFPILRRYGLGISSAISLGNEVNTDIIDALEYFESDERTRVVLLYIEGIRRGRKFVEVARRVSMKKPIIAIYSGGTEAGARSAISHTSAMVVPDNLMDAVFNQTGILRASSLEEMFEWAVALGTQPPMRGKRIGIISLAGGPATSMADVAQRCGLSVPEFSPELQKKIRRFLPHTGSSRNPVDITFSMDMNSFYETLPRLLLESDEIDALAVYYSLGVDFMKTIIRNVEGKISTPPPDMLDEFAAVIRRRFTEIIKESGKPVTCACFMGRELEDVVYYQEEGIPFYLRPESAVRALSALFRYYSFRRKREMKGSEPLK